MPRRARKKSDSGTYHIMLRGINKQQIFEEKEDYEKFLEEWLMGKKFLQFLKKYRLCILLSSIIIIGMFLATVYADLYKSGGYMEVKHPYSGGSFSPK